jgi:hypothetical protein
MFNAAHVVGRVKSMGMDWRLHKRVSTWLSGYEERAVDCSMGGLCHAVFDAGSGHGSFVMRAESVAVLQPRVLDSCSTL